MTADEEAKSEGAAEAPILHNMTIRSSHPPPMTQMQLSLGATLTDMMVRTEVQSCLSDMLMDVETTFYLRQELELEAAKVAIEQTTKQHQATIMEANAERQAREQTQVELADQMVQEVLVLSKELDDLLKWKREHAHKVDEYDVLVKKLAQTEEDLQVTKERIEHLKDVPFTSTPDTATIVEKEVDTIDKTIDKVESTAAASIAPVASEDTSEAQSKEDIQTTDQSTVTGISTTEDKKPIEKEMKPPSQQAAAAVVLDEEEEEGKSTSLVDLDVEILMTIFGFIDAMDILNMAQINVEMYNKIDNIFGISEDGQSPPQPAAPPAAPVKQPASQSELATQATASATTASGSASSPILEQSTGPISNRLFSMLQPVKTAPAGKKQSAQSLTPSAVQSMAAKLNDSEVAAILSMTDKLHRMDKEVQVLRQEKESMAAKLDGTEAVKQFLVNKVRDVECKLSKSRDDEVKVALQIASDQEVIAFLDSRVQELERQTETLTKEKSKAQSELETTKVQTSKKIIMLSDMLKYEREKIKEDESDWKAAKKVLVKEVKSCRSQIVALQAERDGLKEQNEMLRRAIVHTGKSPTSSRPRGESTTSSGSIK